MNSSTDSDNESVVPKKTARIRTKHKQKYRDEWEQNFKPWLQPLKADPYQAQCIACHVFFKANITVIKNHSNGTKHKRMVKHLMQNQPKIPSIIALSKDEEKEKYAIKQAEIKISGFLAKHNLPMLLADHMTPFLKDAFPDSKIAQKINLRRSKATAIIKNVIGKNHQEEMACVLKMQKFSILIDESTDIGTIKNLCVCVRFYSTQEKQVISQFWALIQVFSENTDVERGATAAQLYEKMIESFEKYNIPLANIIGFASDGCNTMFGEKNSVVKRLKDQCPGIIVQKCICHSLHLCASEACKILPRHCEDLVREVYNYFKLSCKRQAQFAQFQEFCHTEPHKLLKPSQTRWLSLLSVVNRIIEQWEPLRLYFTDQWIQQRLQSSELIYNKLNDKYTKLIFMFLQWILPKFVHMNEYFQNDRVITDLHKKMSDAYKDLLLTYMNRDYVLKTELQTIDPTEESKFIPITNIYLGIGVMQYLAKITLSSDEKQDFYFRSRQFIIVSCTEIKKRYNFRDEFLSKIHIFDPKYIFNCQIPSLYEIIKLVPRIVDIENLELIQCIDDEWRQLNISKSEIIIEPNMKIDEFWTYLLNVKDLTGNYKFEHVAKFVLTVLSYPHSNAVCERVFSKVNLIKTDVRNRLCTNTINGLLLTSQAVKKVAILNQQKI